MILEIGSKNYSDDLLSIKKALSHMDSLLGIYNGYVIGEPYSKFGWTFFKVSFKPNLQQGIAKKFSDMLDKYGWCDQSQKFAKFMGDYLNSRGCNVRVSAVDD